MEFNTARPEAPAAVLDTNVALDWLLFGDASVAPLGDAISTGRLRWLACPRMREEFSRVLQYSQLVAHKPDSERLLTAYDRWARMVEAPVALATNPACTDPDDQVFIDLALARGTRWLFTRDRALLKLARRVQPRGLDIVTPAAWRMESA
ncbi:PINc domain-containing protein [Rubrivivax sp. A210]|uniref:PIN domain-containing protein n=1 Tax=Rubrivivax sp. A210 TaxID=2772301 RepID=UPI001918E4F0|nr:PIN domain-containing protein [Rubrivivax sp. A210]CAD5374923.1 PINc domain-containing protein [Rubrivivax sp. A210]